MTYRTVCNQTTLSIATGGYATDGRDRRDVKSQTLETDANGVAQPESVNPKSRDYNKCLPDDPLTHVYTMNVGNFGANYGWNDQDYGTITPTTLVYEETTYTIDILVGTASIGGLGFEFVQITGIVFIDVTLSDGGGDVTERLSWDDEEEAYQVANTNFQTYLSTRVGQDITATIVLSLDTP